MKTKKILFSSLALAGVCALAGVGLAMQGFSVLPASLQGESGDKTLTICNDAAPTYQQVGDPVTVDGVTTTNYVFPETAERSAIEIEVEKTGTHNIDRLFASDALISDNMTAGSKVKITFGIHQVSHVTFTYTNGKIGGTLRYNFFNDNGDCVSDREYSETSPISSGGMTMNCASYKKATKFIFEYTPASDTAGFVLLSDITFTWRC